MPEDIAFRKELARALLSAGRTSLDDLIDVDPAMVAAVPGLTADLGIEFPDGVAPVPQPIVPRPQPGAALPKADVVVITWTVAERNALADVLTPEFPGPSWYRYNRRYESFYDERIREGAPSKRLKILGTYFLCTIGGLRVLCFKSELHLNQDGVKTPPHGQPKAASLPVREMFLQIIEECQPSHVLTVGTCGGIELEHDLGDVLVTRAARFRCQDEFEEAPFNDKTYKSTWTIPTTHFAAAEELMQQFAGNLKEPVFGPPTKRHTGTWKLDRQYTPHIIHDAGADDAAMPKFHPILTTDFFEFGTSKNAGELGQIGCGLEMGDAVLGLAVESLGNAAPKWAVIRNVSDPQINGELPDRPRPLNMQAHWAVWYYEAFGYWTSVMSALTTWAIIAGLEE